MENGGEPKFEAFPYKPYSIQMDFMKALYQSLAKGGISMLESPTGTGKTLSIICSALQWVVDQRHKEKSEKSVESVEKQENDGQIGSDDEPDWIKNFVVNKDHQVDDKKSKKKKYGFGSVKSEKRKNKDSYKDLFSRDADEECLNQKRECKRSIKKDDAEDLGDEEFLLEEYESEEEGKLNSKRKAKVLRLGNSSRINERCLELQKNKKKQVSKIKNLGAEGRIRRTKASSGCPMLRTHKLQKQFRSEMSQQGALDIEDLVQLGRNIGTCPYYGSRSMITTADLLVLPYQSLLSKSSREALGLNLKDSVVIIDEAHNLADSLISMYDAKMTLSQLENVHSYIEKYFGRFRSVLGPGNRRHIQTLLVLTRAFLQVLLHEKDASCLNTCPDAERVVEKQTFDSSMAINDFLFSLNIDNINLIKLLQYIKESNIMHKVSGYGDKMTTLEKLSAVKENGESCDNGSTLSSFQALADMLFSLTNSDGDGRIIISRKRPTCSGQEAHLKFVMLTGEKIFSEIAHEAHAVVLAGGTLQPIEETRERLFPWLPSDQLHFFSCSHIVPPESILPLVVSRGPSGRSFDFSYSLRSSSAMIEELGLLLCNLATVVPEGIVVFFSSFEYEGQVYAAWKTSGILERIMKKKHVFREPRKNTEIETILKEYKEAIDSPAPKSGAILLAVVGGKISEGINFSDGMGRCIVMVGLPYPSPSDIVLLERVKHIEGLGDSSYMKSLQLSSSEEYNGGDVQAGFSILRSCRRRGKEYYENLCMKAVNQSIGYQKLSKPPLLEVPFSCTGCSRRKHPKDQFYYEDWELGLDEARQRKESMTLKEKIAEDDECGESFMNFADKSPVKEKKQVGGKEERKRVGSSKLRKGEEQFYYKRNGGSNALAQKMKELEMMDVGDMEHVLDVEEALHYYSRLKSPVYLSIVDRFFTDMYSEFSVPQASASINTSKRRFGSIRL
ncbi:Helicase-like, DEXD box c2 type [Corchorus olitorius]|uniref:Helicase-like, DEXD box c2 type n=1 Tax=Corchorus olitorius TaxID=93759 RepID=A0A1R3H8R8_9ROSI|nr:Helicase-like, DEXD box c2 type [Corchorus olitorius]